MYASLEASPSSSSVLVVVVPQEGLIELRIVPENRRGEIGQESCSTERAFMYILLAFGGACARWGPRENVT